MILLKFLSRAILSFSICVLLCTTANAQLAKKYKGYEQGFYKEMRYGLFKPDNYDPKKSYPLIVYLHGSRDTVSRDNNFYSADIQKENPSFVLTPKCEEPNQGWGNTWTEGLSEHSKKTMELVNSLIDTYSIDINRLYIYGISMGGFGVYSIVGNEPEKFAAAYAICGGGSEKNVTRLLKTPLWIFHGEKDDVVQVIYSKQVYDEIKKLGGNQVRYTEYPGVKHNSWENVAQEKTLPAWLFAQRKGKTGTAPAPVMNAQLTSDALGATLSWNKPATPQTDESVWYYKIFRDNTLLAEVDGTVQSYSDRAVKKGSTPVYHLVAVSYFFKESAATKPIKAVAN